MQTRICIYLSEVVNLTGLFMMTGAKVQILPHLFLLASHNFTSIFLYNKKSKTSVLLFNKKYEVKYDF